MAPAVIASPLHVYAALLQQPTRYKPANTDVSHPSLSRDTAAAMLPFCKHERPQFH